MMNHYRWSGTEVRHAIAALAIAGTAALAAGGCASHTSTAAPPSDSSAQQAGPKAAWPSAVPTTGLTKGMVLPLEAYMVSYPDEVSITQAVNRLEATCMAGYGFTYVPLPPGSNPPPSPDDANMSRRYGIADPAQARAYGYHLPSGNNTPPAPRQLSAAERTVLTGESSPGAEGTAQATSYHGTPLPPEGCTGYASRAVGARFNTSLVDQLDVDSLNTAQNEPRVKTALGLWSACMKTKGYSVDIPFHAPQLTSAGINPTADSEEIAVATADVTCKQQTDLVATWFAADKVVQQQEIAQHRSVLMQIQREIDTAVKNSATS